jgi:ribonuclease E
VPEAAGSVPVLEPSRATGPAPQDSDTQPAAALVNATERSIGGVQGVPAPEPVEPAPPRRAPAPPPQHVLANQKVITEADPDRPKRGGWWQRAKATLTGGE